jgi:hypothetical protein
LFIVQLVIRGKFKVIVVLIVIFIFIVVVVKDDIAIVVIVGLEEFRTESDMLLSLASQTGFWISGSNFVVAQL